MNSKEEIKLKSGIKTLAMWLIILLIFIVVVTSIVNNKDNELAYSELVSRIETGDVKEVKISADGTSAEIL